MHSNNLVHNSQNMGSHNSLTPSKVGSNKTHILSPHAAIGNYNQGMNQLNVGQGHSSKTPKEAYKRV